jgi:hypothetical protein
MDERIHGAQSGAFICFLDQSQDEHGSVPLAATHMVAYILI